jgi:predicted 3-demethylubiquinone-9 3-methyltransferase (glyoxalase superfamily)
MSSQKITTFLWYDNQAEEAAIFYTSLFKRSCITNKTPLVVSFILDGQEFSALNGGPEYKFTPAMSLLIKCDDQAEVDHFWDAFSGNGGTPNRCGWVADKWGVSWQVVPRVLPELIGDPDKEKAGRAMEAMLKMVKLDIAKLQEAHAGE